MANDNGKLKSALSRIPAEKIPDEYLSTEFAELQEDPSVAEFLDVALRVYGIKYGIILRIAASPAGSALLSAAFTAAGVPIPPNVLTSLASAGLDAQNAYQAAKYGSPAPSGQSAAEQPASAASASRGGERRTVDSEPPATDNRKKIALAALAVLGIASTLL